MNTNRQLRRIGSLPQTAAVLFGYTLLALIFTYPLGLNLNRYVVGLDVDAEEYLWSFWWMRKAILELGANPYLTDWLYYPSGVSLYFFASSPLHAFFSVPLQLLFGLIPAYNIIGLLAFVVSGYTTYLLAYDITRHRGASFLAGVLFAFAPTQIFHLEVGQPNLNAVEVIPLYVLCLRRWLGGGALRWLLGAAISLVLTSFNDWQFAIYCQLFTGMLLLAEFIVRRSEWRKAIMDLVWRTAALQVIYVLTVLPVVIPMLGELGGPDPYMVRKRTDTVYHSADLLAFLVPNPMHPLWRGWAEPLRLSLQTPGVTVTVVSLSYVGMLLAALALWRRWQEARFWFFTGLAFLVLALGPELLVLGRSTGILLPYEALFQLPIIRISRAPARYVVMTLLCLAVLAALGARVLLQGQGTRDRGQGDEGTRDKGQGTGDRGTGLPLPTPHSPLPTPRSPLLATLFLVAVLCFELLPAPVNAHAPAPTPSFFTDGTLREAGALLEVPNPSNRGMYFAVVHNRPVMYGELSRDNPPGPLLEHLRKAYAVEEIIGDTHSWRCLYRAFDITHLVLYPDPADVGGVRRQQVEASLPPEQFLVSDTPEGRLYRMPENPPGETCVLIGRGWQGARKPTPEEPLHRWAGQSALLGLLRSEPGRVRLHFTANSFAVPRQVEARVGGELVALLDVGQPQSYSLDLDLPAGITWLELRSLQPALDPRQYGYRETTPIAFGLSEIWIERR